MIHDATKVLLGATTSSDRLVTNEDGDPATFKAGLAVRLSTTGALQLADDATAARIGISLGDSLSDTKRVAVCRTGNWVPLKLKDESVKSSATVTVTSYANLVSGTDDVVTIGGIAFTAQAGAATPGAATFQAATSNNATATSLAAQINAHETASMLVSATAVGAVVTLEAVDAGDEGDDITVAYTDNDSNVGATVSGATLSGGADAYAWLVPGAIVKTDDVTGEGSSDGDPTSATYLTGPLTGIYPDGSTVWVACIDMGGGL